MRDGEEILGQYLELEGNKMLAEQPRPDNLIPIIGFSGEFSVMFGAG